MKPNILYHGKWANFCEQDGWEFCTRTKGTCAVIIPSITANDEFIFVEQLRRPVGGNCIEWPAGIVGDEDENEDSEDAAVRELLEETGYEAGDVAKIFGRYSASPGILNEMLDFVVCSDCKKVSDGGGVDDENIIVHVVPKDEVHNWIIQKLNDGVQIDAKIYIGLYFLEIF